jgi:hypothetical protein
MRLGLWTPNDPALPDAFVAYSNQQGRAFAAASWTWQYTEAAASRAYARVTKVTLCIGMYALAGATPG